MNPKVVYDGLDVAFFVDPRSSQNYKKSTEFFFQEAKIDGYTIDFEGFYDVSSTITANTVNSVRGIAR